MSDKTIDMGTGEVFENSTAVVVRAREAAVLDMQVSTAKEYPRSVERFQDDLRTWATSDKDIATSCFYTKPGQGGPKIGPSVRMAELVVAAYTNLYVESSSVEHPTYVEGIAMCRDMERNHGRRMTIQRSIVGKDKKRYPDHLIAQHMQIAESIAMRNAVFAVVPRALWWPIYEAARKVSMGEGKSLSEVKKGLLKTVGGYDVPMEHVVAYLGGRHERDWTADDIMSLHLRCKSVAEDGMEPAVAFPKPKPMTSVKSKDVGNQKGREKLDTKKEPAPGIDVPADEKEEWTA